MYTYCYHFILIPLYLHLKYIYQNRAFRADLRLDAGAYTSYGLKVEYCAAFPNWLKMRGSERRDFTPNAEHVFVDKRTLLNQIKCVKMTSRRHAP